MIKMIFNNLNDSTRELLRSRSAMVSFALVYLLLLLSLGLFVASNLATMQKVAVTFATLVIVPVLFFLLQSFCVVFEAQAGPALLWRRGVAICLRLMAITLPVILLACAINLLLARLLHAGPGYFSLLFIARVVMFGIIAPLASIHLWISVLHSDSFAQALTQSARTVRNAFAAQSLLTYTIGWLLFCLLPFLLLRARVPLGQPGLELASLLLRVCLALMLAPFAWVVTVIALRKTVAADSLSFSDG